MGVLLEYLATEMNKFSFVRNWMLSLTTINFFEI